MIWKLDPIKRFSFFTLPNSIEDFSPWTNNFVGFFLFNLLIQLLFKPYSTQQYSKVYLKYFLLHMSAKLTIWERETTVLQKLIGTFGCTELSILGPYLQLPNAFYNGWLEGYNCLSKLRICCLAKHYPNLSCINSLFSTCKMHCYLSVYDHN